MRPFPVHLSLRRAVPVVAAAFLVLLAAAGGDAARAQDREAYRLSVGDVVSVTVFGRTELSGRFPISPDGSLAFPLLGAVAAAGLTPPELGQRLDQGLAEHIPGVSVTASVFEYAPVFIVGEVQTPGRYPYRPGMTALELLALGGGLRRPATALQDSTLQMIAVRQDYADLELQIFGQETRRDRLTAEIADAPYQPEAEIDEPDPAWRVVKQNIVAGERRLHEMRQSALETDIQAFRDQEASFDQEIASVTASIALYKREVDLLMEDVAAQRSLVERGLVAKSILREVERSLSATRRDALEQESFLSRARQNRLAIEQRRVALATTRRNDAARELQELEIGLARMRARQRSLLTTMSELALLAGGDATVPQAQASYTIMRMAGDGFDEVVAGEGGQLKPGDIVRVSLPPPTRTRQASLD